MDHFESALAGRTDLHCYGSNAQLLLALELRFQNDDIHMVASDSLTDGNDDKKCDLIYLNVDDNVLVIAQGYRTERSVSEAPAGKAMDLNTAAGWIFTQPIDRIPERLKAAVDAVRQALHDGQIKTIEFWYVHNCPESQNVARELSTVEATVDGAIRTYFGESGVASIRAIEVGKKTLEDWYVNLETPILVSDNIPFDIPGGFSESGADWKAYVTTIPGDILYHLFGKYGVKLFSANLRSYLGSRRVDANINNNIKRTAYASPGDFWVFNNGLTAIVNDFVIAEDGSSVTSVGMSIVNGAQTTGAIGSLIEPPVGVRIQIRLVKCLKRETIHEIIKYNNSQNPLLPSDFRSTDGIQRRLRSEFERIPNADYAGGRRGGADDVIRRSANLLPSDTVAQALAAVHGEPQIAYHERSRIWTEDGLYSRFFCDSTTAEHIVFCYSLLRAIESKKTDLKTLAGTLPLTGSQKDELEFLRKRGATILLTSAISSCLETVLGRVIPNLFKVSFGTTTSPAEAEALWKPIVDIAMSFAPGLSGSLARGIGGADEVRQNIKNFGQLIKAVSQANGQIFGEFSSSVVWRE